MFSKILDGGPMSYLYRYKLLFAILGLTPVYGHTQQSKEIENKLVIEPRVFLQQTITDNAALSRDKKGGYVTQISPGLRIYSNTARIKGFADYSLDAIADSNGVRNHYIRNQLFANATVEAVEQFAFIDINASIATQPISAFGAPVYGNRVTSNSAETKNFRISPYVRGRVKENLDYEARYSIQDIRGGANKIGNSITQDFVLNLEKPLTGQVIGWSTTATYQNSDFVLGRTITDSTLRGTLNYLVMPQLVFSGIIGAESTNQLSPTRESHSIAGVGAKWQPSERTRVSLLTEKRYFGNSHNIVFEHRTARTVWRYTDSKGISNTTGNASYSLGSAYDLLNGFYEQVESDPILRRQLIMAEIERLGISSSTEIFQDFLRSANTLQRAQNLSLALLGKRTTVTLSAFRLDNRRLAGSLNLGDDFDSNTRILQNGMNLLMSHRLTPNLSAYTNLSTQRNRGTIPGAENKINAVTLGLNQNLSRQTSASIQLNRSLSDSAISPYNESSIVGTLTHRF